MQIILCLFLAVFKMVMKFVGQGIVISDIGMIFFVLDR